MPTCALSGSISGAGKSIEIRLRMCGPPLYVQTSSKPCSNLKSMGPDDASRCDRILKESSINSFLRAATVGFVRCLELRFDWGLYI